MNEIERLAALASPVVKQSMRHLFKMVPLGGREVFGLLHPGMEGRLRQTRGDPLRGLNVNKRISRAATN